MSSDRQETLGISREISVSRKHNPLYGASSNQKHIIVSNSFSSQPHNSATIILLTHNKEFQMNFFGKMQHFCNSIFEENKRDFFMILLLKFSEEFPSFFKRQLIISQVSQVIIAFVTF